MNRRTIAMTMAVVCLLLLGGILALTREDEPTLGDGTPITHTIIAGGAETEAPAADAAAAPGTEPGDGTSDGAEPAAGPEEAAPETTEEPAERSSRRSSRRSEESDGWFADAAFVGNSQVMALELYDYDGILTGADFYETDTMTGTGWIDDMEGATYGKYYLGLGAKELDWRDDAIRQGIEKAIDSLRSARPDCRIFLMGVPPVSEYRSSTDSTINKDRAQYINTLLQQIAAERGAKYLDVFSALCDENGYIPSEVTVNGVDFTPGQYEGWYELLRTTDPDAPEKDGES